MDDRSDICLCQKMNSGLIVIKNKHLSTELLSITLLAIMYSFGTFGFLNLLGVRTIIQILLIGLVVSLFVALQPRYKPQDLFPVLFFFGLYAIGSLTHGNIMTGPIEAVLMLFVLHVIFSASPQQILSFSRALVVVTSFLCLLVAIAYIYYRINPDQFTYANFDIYSSETGQQQVYASHFMDWISFTSGDGFEFLGESSPRMKGYSNEPSSTIVHYLAPAVLAFLLGGRYNFLGVFILLVNVVAIASFTGHIIVALSFAIYIAIKFFRRYLKYAASLTLVFFLAFLIQPTLIATIFENVSAQAIHHFGFDLISRKLGGASFESRNDGMINGLIMVFSSPLGYSSESLGPGAGLIYIVSSYTGWLGLSIFCVFIFKLLNNANKASATSLPTIRYSLSLLFAVLLITLFVSGYGWNRPPGVIMLFLFFRMIQLSVTDSYRQVQTGAQLLIRKHENIENA